MDTSTNFGPVLMIIDATTNKRFLKRLSLMVALTLASTSMTSVVMRELRSVHLTNQSNIRIPSAILMSIM